MSDSRGGFALANNKTGEYVSKAVTTLAEAQKLLETVYARQRGDLMICDLWSRPHQPRPPKRASSDSGQHTVDQGDNSPG
jgi:hypothetical protein